MHILYKQTFPYAIYHILTFEYMTLLSENLRENKKKLRFNIVHTELKTKALFYQQVGVLFEILNAKNIEDSCVDCSRV